MPHEGPVLVCAGVCTDLRSRASCSSSCGSNLSCASGNSGSSSNGCMSTGMGWCLMDYVMVIGVFAWHCQRGRSGELPSVDAVQATMIVVVVNPLAMVGKGWWRQPGGQPQAGRQIGPAGTQIVNVTNNLYYPVVLVASITCTTRAITCNRDPPRQGLHSDIHNYYTPAVHDNCSMLCSVVHDGFA